MHRRKFEDSKYGGSFSGVFRKRRIFRGPRHRHGVIHGFERSGDEGCSRVGDLVGEFSSLYICGRSSDFHFAYLMMVAHEERKTEEILFNIRAWRSVAELRGTGNPLRECLFEGCR